MDINDDFTGVMDFLPEGAMPIYSMRYVRYIDPKSGESFFTWRSDGNQLLSLTVGDLYRIIGAFLEDDEVLDIDDEAEGV